MYINSAFGLFVVAVPLDCAVLTMSKMDKSARWVQSGLTRRGYRPVNFTSIHSREQSVIVAGTPAKGGNPHRSAFVTDAAGASPWARPTSSPRCIGSSRPAAIAGSRVPTPMPLSEGCVPATCGAEESGDPVRCGAERRGGRAFAVRTKLTLGFAERSDRAFLNSGRAT